jgi:hypothetical protein
MPLLFDAVNTSSFALLNNVITPAVLMLALDITTAALLFVVRTGTIRAALGYIVVGPPVKVQPVVLEVPVIVGISIVTMFPTRTTVTVPVGAVVIPVAVAVKVNSR